MEPNILKEALKLPSEEKLQLIENLWESIHENPESISITQVQKDELNKRLVNYKNNPENVITWDALKAELLDKK